MNIRNVIKKYFGGVIKNEDIDKIFSDDYLKPRLKDVFGVIIQFDERNLTFEEFNDFLSLLGKEKFIVMGIIGTLVFAYKKHSLTSGDECEFLRNNNFQKKILFFKKNIEFRNCGGNGRYIYIPFILSKNIILETLQKMEYNQTCEIFF
jgi:hypothetical protein